MSNCLCPCGSKLAFSECCQAVILGQSIAKTPEQLMCSRYSAYAMNYPEYIYNTYADITKREQSIKDISEWAKQTSWCLLNVDKASTANSQQNDTATVDFTATYKENNKFYIISEHSRFIVENGCWRYLDGDIKQHQELQLKRNDNCLCQSGKKFKKCCM